MDSDLFMMAGRMTGHCFLHGRPPLSGLSPAVVHAISGGSSETANNLQISDCPDFNLHQKIKMVYILHLDIQFVFEASGCNLMINLNERVM